MLHLRPQRQHQSPSCPHRTIMNAVRQRDPWNIYETAPSPDAVVCHAVTLFCLHMYMCNFSVDFEHKLVRIHSTYDDISRTLSVYTYLNKAYNTAQFSAGEMKWPASLYAEKMASSACSTWLQTDFSYSHLHTSGCICPQTKSRLRVNELMFWSFICFLSRYSFFALF